MSDNLQDFRLEQLEQNQEKMLEQMTGISRNLQRCTTLLEERSGDHDKVIALESEVRGLRRLVWGAMGIGGTAVAGHAANALGVIG